MSERRLLITGGGSYLGRHLVPLAAQAYDARYTFFKNDPLALPFGTQLDVRDDTTVTQLINQVQPQVIIHTVGSNRGRDVSGVTHGRGRSLEDRVLRANGDVHGG